MTTFHVPTFHDLRALVGDRYGRFDVPCPACGPLCRAASNRRRPVLRVWREEAEFISFCCARRGQRGFAKDCESPPTPAPRDRERAKARAAAAVQRQHAHLVQNTARALAIWNDAQPICGTLAEQSPAWALGDAGGIAAFPVLSGVEAITILADNDNSGTGQRAAETCARRWVAAGREARVLLPHKIGADFNDIIAVVCS